jgi:hypothetical protein
VVAAVAHLDVVVHGVVVAEEVEAVEVEAAVEVVDVAGASKELNKQATIYCDLAMGVGNHIWEACKHRVGRLQSISQSKIDV